MTLKKLKIKSWVTVQFTMVKYQKVLDLDMAGAYSSGKMAWLMMASGIREKFKDKASLKKKMEIPIQEIL